MRTVGILTPRSLVDLVLDEEIDHRNNRDKESGMGRQRLAADCERADKRCSDIFSA